MPGEKETTASVADSRCPKMTVWRPQPFDHDEEEVTRYLCMICVEEKKLDALNKSEYGASCQRREDRAPHGLARGCPLCCGLGLPRSA
jgi:hypothetical protein